MPVSVSARVPRSCRRRGEKDLRPQKCLLSPATQYVTMRSRTALYLFEEEIR
jgi:hypothetical protein